MKKKTIKCPYCGGVAVLRDASFVHGENAFDEYLYVCQNYPECNAYVGVHRGTLIPKGTLANGDLRNKRIMAHHSFDRIWKEGILTKRNAYKWMQDKFSMNSNQAHIGNFSEYMCDQLIEESEKVMRNNANRIKIGGKCYG